MGQSASSAGEKASKAAPPPGTPAPAESTFTLLRQLPEAALARLPDALAAFPNANTEEEADAVFVSRCVRPSRSSGLLAVLHIAVCVCVLQRPALRCRRAVWRVRARWCPGDPGCD